MDAGLQDDLPESLDLGDLELPMLVFGGPYGNLEATRALFDEADRLGIPSSRMICTGDTVAYCADPAATVDLLRGRGVPVLMGNCEENLAVGAADCGCGFEDGTACDLLSQQWYAFCVSEIDADDRLWMASLPRRIELTLGGARFSVVHGAASGISTFVFGSTDAAVKANEIALTGAGGVLAGHCGLPFTQVVRGQVWHNAGVIGMPANDGTPRAWYSLIEAGQDGALRFAHRTLAYDADAAAEKMRRRGLPDGYAGCLQSGLWPSLDVLPAAEREETGVPLHLSDVEWAPVTA